MKGGPTERMSAAVLLFDYVTTAAIRHAPAPFTEEIAVGLEAITMIIFLWLAFTRDRWWLLAASAALILCNLVGLVGFLHPDVSHYAAASAQIGLWMVVYLALIAGVAERWLAGERPVGGVAIWRRQRAAP